MDLVFKNRINGLGGRIVLLVLSLVACVLTSLLSQLGILLIPISAVMLTLLFLSERGAHHTLSVAACVIAISVDFAFNALYSLCVLASVIIAFLVYLSMTKLIFTKGECAILITLLIAVLIGYMVFTTTFFEIGKVDFNGALDYYASVVDELKVEWEKNVDKIVAANPQLNEQNPMTAELLVASFDAFVASSVSMMAILAFMIAGLMFKLLGVALSIALKDKDAVAGWHFILTPAYAYAFLAAYVISIFLEEADIFGITVLNFVNVFMAIFAYLGFIFVLSILERRFTSKLAALAVAIIALLIFAPTAMQLLAFIGTFAVVLYDKAHKIGGDFDKE